MRLTRVPPPVVAGLLVFVGVVLWALASGRLTGHRPIELKRDPRGVPLAEQFTPEEYLRFRAEHPSEQEALDEYLWQAVEAGREVDALRAVGPDERATAGEQLTFALINKADSSRYPKDEAKHGPAIRRLRELRPHLGEPHTSIVHAFLLFCDGQFEQAEAAFAKLPAEYQAGPNHKRWAIYHCRLAGFFQRGAWREAYRKLEPRRVAFHQIGLRWLFRSEPSAEHEELIRLHREADPDDPIPLYHSVFLRFNQKRYAEVVELAAEYESRPQDTQDELLRFSTPIVDLRFRHAFSLAMLGRCDEAEAMDSQLVSFSPARDRVRLAVALKRGDPATVEKLLSDYQDMTGLAHTDPHLAPLFRDDKFAELRKKYPSPTK